MLRNGVRDTSGVQYRLADQLFSAREDGLDDDVNIQVKHCIVWIVPVS